MMWLRWLTTRRSNVTQDVPDGPKSFQNRSYTKSSAVKTDWAANLPGRPCERRSSGPDNFGGHNGNTQKAKNLVRKNHDKRFEERTKMVREILVPVCLDLLAQTRNEKGLGLHPKGPSSQQLRKLCTNSLSIQKLWLSRFRA
jgi:hypothetical protein